MIFITSSMVLVMVGGERAMARVSDIMIKFSIPHDLEPDAEVTALGVRCAA
ncbi:MULTISPECIES: hypothetical protein [Nitrosomonas]|uniref:hypothetical protein n=1 Tax=Nitrosomonas TaxID=914 RepID=UPI0013563F09|nr:MULTISPECIES: hypothetical protein [Nitrosomonas]